jgi:hypothetical protein
MISKLTRKTAASPSLEAWLESKSLLWRSKAIARWATFGMKNRVADCKRRMVAQFVLEQFQRILWRFGLDYGNARSVEGLTPDTDIAYGKISEAIPANQIVTGSDLGPAIR